ncbi:hypothetical protein CH063_07177 [Colletotrichum higginsianum]|uniref:Uncharacterized protein n=1 Tax=Colletotrichum higginsianum (strain IMI 349063) TaxID=759273 RepID=H1V573_COLHI|nr:hypothetical protein CH63R_03831 [Colletotrichum higginsianum IMI 349063]OBR11535.1 hypothetical protein CH63R_03831 [Colletotrichum higginsianum IMI 349063]CCF35375.1 hypothetical protein CH063_07177 [Colletotrichum higginsianum]
MEFLACPKKGCSRHITERGLVFPNLYQRLFQGIQPPHFNATTKVWCVREELVTDRQYAWYFLGTSYLQPGPNKIMTPRELLCANMWGMHA